MAIQNTCHLLVVGGGKGGIGKSVMAANFSLALMQEMRTPVLLIDGDSKSVGDQNLMLGVKPVKTIRELASMSQSLASTPLQQLITVHPSGLHYLAAVRGPDESLSIPGDHLAKVLEFFSRSYKYIVVDIGNDVGPIQNVFLQEATAVMVVTTPEVLVVQQTQKFLNELYAQAYPRELFQLVVNKSGIQGLSPQSIAQHLQILPVGVLPADENLVTTAVNSSKPFLLTNNKAPLSAAYFEMVRRLTGGTLQKLKAAQKPRAASPAISEVVDTSSSSGKEGQDPRTLLKIRIHNELIRTIDLKKLLSDLKDNEGKEKEVRDKTARDISLITDKEAPDLVREEKQKIVKEVLEEALGLGPIEDLLKDPAVSEIMVNGHKKIYVERSGNLTLSGIKFTSNDHLRRVIERIVTPLGRQINNSTPYVDARLKDGSRVNAVIEPLAIDGPALTIRKFKKGGINPEKYIEFGSATKSMLDFLKICVENRYNIVISGGTGSGKTSLLNMISSFILPKYRIITVEDAAELQMMQDHVVRLETRPPSMEGSHAITIRDLIKNALRMRPDIIVVGETRDGAALDMLQAMNTGHDGSMTTTHANSPRECLARLETLVMMAGMEMPIRAIREQVAGAIDLIVQISRMSDGSRKITSITEVVGMQGDVVSLAEIFKFKETGTVMIDGKPKIQGIYQATGAVPSFVQELKDSGIQVAMEIFSTETPQQKPQQPKAGAIPNVSFGKMPTKKSS